MLNAPTVEIPFTRYPPLALAFDIVIYIFLCNLYDRILLKLKACPSLPFIANLVQFAEVCPVALDHDTVCIELDDFQPGNVFVEVLCQL